MLRLLVALPLVLTSPHAPERALLESLDRLESAVLELERPTSSQRTLGGYPSRVEAPPEVLAGEVPADLLVVLLHGHSSKPEEDVGAVPEALARDEALDGRRIMYVMPQAPTPKDSVFGAAWWDASGMVASRLSSGLAPLLGAEKAQQFGGMLGAFAHSLLGTSALERSEKEVTSEAEAEDEAEAEPQGLSTCRGRMSRLLSEARQLAGGSGAALPAERVLVGGFSQGAMTALDAALQAERTEQVGGVIFLSGAPFVTAQWKQRLRRARADAKRPAGSRLGGLERRQRGARPLRVLVAHGKEDALLPVSGAQRVETLLREGGACVQGVRHPGKHEIGGPAVLRAVAEFARATLEHDDPSSGCSSATESI